MDDRLLNRLAAERDISWLLAEYCRALDVMDLEAIAAVFTDACVVEYGPDAALKTEGNVAVAQALARLWRFERTSHHLSNIQIAVEGGDRARALSYVWAWHERPDKSVATVMGQYHDELQKTAEGWRIHRRRMEMSGADAGFAVNLFRLQRRPPPPGWSAPANIDKR